jgi:hypothetical protein
MKGAITETFLDINTYYDIDSIELDRIFSPFFLSIEIETTLNFRHGQIVTKYCLALCSQKVKTSRTGSTSGRDH